MCVITNKLGSATMHQMQDTRTITDVSVHLTWPIMQSHSCNIIYFQGNLTTTPVILEGTTANARFGNTIANAGDLNADGHEGQ